MKHSYRIYRDREFCRTDMGFASRERCGEEARAWLADPVCEYTRAEIYTGGKLAATIYPSTTQEQQ